MSKIASKMTGLTIDSPFVDEMERAQTLYFNWLCSMVHMDSYFNKKWFILAKTLHNIEYYSLIDHDDNRAADGINLRHTWFNLMDNEAEDLGVGRPMFPLDSLSGPCSLFEMLVGLSVRIESDVMQDHLNGNCTYLWFWSMIGNVLRHDLNRINAFEDDKITEEAVDLVIKRFTDVMDRKYEADGTGGLFPINNPSEDQTKIEIWYQAQAWLMENYYDELEGAEDE